ncbi:tetratricopeptide repeat protein [Aestuariicoccus sp. MJ-SS9]|uniref:tetratricopeptide repeat protein n=1 Tax=Aestuariicoccus sp. MJ-SS9 TaxID=3079855 RepID=UPI002906A2B5|nr:tetratricopeptide repeat protein [Aestuariicoccus sp. MJ-SS9]MDU8910418.1 tol-pal system protein [Aestuariicoccus sp. MJ-SS9]
MRFAAVLLSATLAAGSLPAQQAETLADIRQDLSVLYIEIQRLRTELSTTGASDVLLSGGTLDRINAIESELQRVTAKTEELEYRIEIVVQDGTNRIGDLEFRLCELEPACDIAALGDTPRLGGAEAPSAAPADPLPGDSPVPAGTELAVGEEADFMRAQEALNDGDGARAAELFAAFRQTYPGGPLEAAALLGEGRGLEAAGDTREAARRYLDAYANYPEADAAPEALWRLGVALGALGKVPEACVTLAEVGARYAGDVAVTEAQDSMAALNCQ